MIIGEKMKSRLRGIWKDRRGMSLVEIIIVIAIVGILAGVTASMYGQIRHVNTKKVVEEVETELKRQRLSAMTKAGKTYLYLYGLGDGYYMKTSTVKKESFDTGFFTADGTKICGKNAKIYKDSAVTSHEITEANGNFIRICYKRSGVFDYNQPSGEEKNTNTETLIIEGSSVYQIRLVEETGKYYVEKM